MAIQKTIIKNDSQRAVIHMVGTDGGGESSTVLLTDLINTPNGETSSGTLQASISYFWSVSDANNASSVVVMRGTSTVIMVSGSAEYPGNQQLPSIGINNGNDIKVIFNGKGTVSLDVRKIGGYQQPNRNVGV